MIFFAIIPPAAIAFVGFFCWVLRECYRAERAIIQRDGRGPVLGIPPVKT